MSANLQGTDSGGKRKNYCSTTVEKEMGGNLAAGLELKTLISLFAFSSFYSVRDRYSPMKIIIQLSLQ